MDVPLKARVFCENILAGNVATLILNPVTRQVTHIVVRTTSGRRAERLVGLEHLAETDTEHVHLGCTRADLDKMPNFSIAHYVEIDLPELEQPDPAYLTFPYALLDQDGAFEREEAVPPDEIVFRRGTPVFAKDGFVGRADEFVVDPERGFITHLVMLERHNFQDHDVTIPIWRVKELDDDGVQLHLDKEQVAELPHVRVRRRNLKLPFLSDG